MGLLSNNTSAGSVPGLSAFNEGGDEGLRNAQSLIKMNEQGYDRHRLIQARDTIGQAWASGDPAKLDAAMRMFPEYIPQMQKQMGIRDDRHRLDVGSMTAKLHGLLSAGDTEGAKALVQQNANLFDKSGPYSAQGVVDMIGSGDKDKLKRLDNWAQSTTMGTLTPLEIIKEGDAQQRLGLDQQRLAQNYDLGQRRIGLGYERLSHQDLWNQWRHDDRRGGNSAFGVGLQTVQLSNGNTVQIDPKVHGAGANAFYQGRDANGNIIDVPVSSVTTPISATEQAGNTELNSDLDTLANASDDDLGHVTGWARGGGVGDMPFGADSYTGYAGGTSRDIYSAAKRIQGNMQNKGIAAAKSMGASGINTVTEAKMYFQSMPQLDFSSPEALKKSVGVIKDYTRNYNAKHDVSYPAGAGKGKDTVSGMSDKELLEGL